MASNVVFSLFGVLLLSGPQSDTTLEQQDRGNAAQLTTVLVDELAGGPAREPVRSPATTPVASDNPVQQDDGATAASAGDPEREPMALHVAATPVVSSLKKDFPGQLPAQSAVAPEPGSSNWTPGPCPGNLFQQLAEMEKQEKELCMLRQLQADEDARALERAEQEALIDAELAAIEKAREKKKRTFLAAVWYQLTGKKHRLRNVTVVAVIALLIWWLRRIPGPPPRAPRGETPPVTPGPPTIPPPSTPDDSVVGDDVPVTPPAPFHGDPGSYRYVQWTRHAEQGSASREEALERVHTPPTPGRFRRHSTASTLAPRALFQDSPGAPFVRMNRAARFRLEALRNKQNRGI